MKVVHHTLAGAVRLCRLGCLAWTLEMAIFCCAVSAVASNANLFSGSSSQIVFLSQLRGK